MNSGILNKMGIDPGILLILCFILLIVLILIFVSLRMRVRRMEQRLSVFMRGQDAKSLEDNFAEHFTNIDRLISLSKIQREEMKTIQKRVSNGYQRIGLVRYDAFDQMGGKLSFALTLLDGKGDGFLLNAMHSTEGCYTYIKEIVKGESYIELSDEEQESLHRALYQEGYTVD